MTMSHPADRDRLRAALAVVLVHVALGYALLAGLKVNFAQPIATALKIFVPLPPPEPKREPPPLPESRAPRKAGAAAPPGLKAKATEVVAPPIVVAQPPPPVVVTLKSDSGAALKSGASTVDGPGTGAGGVGDGSGSGGAGDGDGGGGTPLRQIGGRITGRDYPERPYRAGIGGTLYVRYVVGVKGRVTGCRVVRSSGNAELDDTTCRLIAQRFRYKPRRDPTGKSVPTVIVEDHTWVVDRAPRNEEGVPGQNPDTP